MKGKIAISVGWLLFSICVFTDSSCFSQGEHSDALNKALFAAADKGDLRKANRLLASGASANAVLENDGLS